LKTTISLPNALFDAADTLAGRLGVSRSVLYATALTEFVARHADSEITARLNEVYADGDNSVDSVLRRVQRESIGREEW
jgi:predicted transcriptional regulator